MTTLREILEDDIFKKSFKTSDEESKKELIKLLGLYGGFSEEGQSVILDENTITEKLNSDEFISAQDFNQKVLQKIYQKIRPAKSDGVGLVERKDMQNPQGVIENISQFNLAESLERLGIFEEKKPPVLERSVRIILNGATQVGCQERIDSVKGFIGQGLIPETAIIDLATGTRDLWPDGIGSNDSGSYQPDSMLTTLLSERTRKSVEEITRIIFDERAKLVGNYQTENPQLTISTLSSQQKADLRKNITESLKSEFVKSNPEFAWPQESDMFLRLAQENFPQMQVVVHGGAADPTQGRATGATGLKKVALDLIEEVKSGELNGNANLAVIAGGGHALRFSAILSDEITSAAKDIPEAINNFAFHPAGPSFSKNTFVIAQNNSSQNVAQNLLNLTEANFGAINHEMSRRMAIELKPAPSPRNSELKKFREEIKTQELGT